VELASVCARNGLSVRGAVEKDGFARGTTDYRELLADPDVDVVYVATRHDQHYPIACAAVEAGKAVFVEKPMTMTAAEGRDLVERVAKHKVLLTVGFNRRFSPHVVRLREALAPITAPRTILFRVNAGPLPSDHWLLDPTEGGGRILGEGVHFFDLMRFISGSEIRQVTSVPGAHPRDEATVTLSFADGSLGTLVYATGGNAEAGKERLEVFSGGASFILDDFRSLTAFGVSMPAFRTRSIEKGQAGQLENFMGALRGEAKLGVTAEDGYWATWCAEKATEPE
jgi:predicted dehydrogenase